MERRFVVACAGRRSGKTERIKRDGVAEAINFSEFSDGKFVFAGPTQQQAKDIWWEDLKLLTPDWALLENRRKSVLESTPQTIKLYNGTRIVVVGMDKPFRVEGSPVDWIALDEYADMKPNVLGETIIPLVSTHGRPGKVRILGKPRGRNHYWRLVQDAKRDESGLWAYHHWRSHEVLTPGEIQVLANTLDPLTFDQEVNANFVNFEGRAYHSYDEQVHVFPVQYIPGLDLIFTFDFNQSPGTAAVLQEQEATPELRSHLIKHGCSAPPPGETVTCVLDEVWIPRGSNSRMVAQRLLEDWGGHQGEVRLCGDATGGAKTSQAVLGSDWDLILEVFRPRWGRYLNEAWPRANPPVRARVNAVNTRLRTAGSRVAMIVSPRCAHVSEDFGGVTLVEGTGEIDKDADEQLTHLSDGIGYYVQDRWPIGGRGDIWQP